MRITGYLLMGAAALFLSGCTTIASRVAIAPPGVSKYSFRECLLGRSFYSPTALTGIALRDWHYRHGHAEFLKKDKGRKEPTRYELLEQKDAAFVATAAKVIADGLMPVQEYWDTQVTDRQVYTDGVASTVQGAPNEAPHFNDKGVNSPYVDVAAPQQYDFSRDAETAQPILPQQRPSAGHPDARDWRLNRFLDCYIAPVGVSPAPFTSSGHDLTSIIAHENGDEDLEGRLLRGHILLTLLAQYGTELIVSHPSRKQVAQAELLLGHIKDAETSLRGASMVMDSRVRDKAAALITATDTKGQPVLLQKGQAYLAAADGSALLGADGKAQPATLGLLSLADFRGEAQFRLGWADYTTRLLRVFQVGVDIQRIDTQQTLDRAANLIAAFAGQSGGFLAILKDGLAGAVTVQKVKLYGNAYLRDARETLAVVRRWTKRDKLGTWTYAVAPTTQGWSLWDQELARVCTVLSTVAKKDPSNADCIPKEAGATP